MLLPKIAPVSIDAMQWRVRFVLNENRPERPYRLLHKQALLETQ